MTWLDVLLSVIGVLVSGLAAVLWSNYQSVLSKLADLDKEIEDIRKNLEDDVKNLNSTLSAHQLYASENFARSKDVRDSFERLHECVDDIQKTVNATAVLVASITGKISHRDA